MKCYNRDCRGATKNKFLYKEKYKMEKNYLKDMLFDWLNDNSEDLKISDIQTHEKENTYGISMMDGSVFEIGCRCILESEV